MSIREKRVSFKELLAKEKGVLAPCVFDSASARVAYTVYYKKQTLPNISRLYNKVVAES